MLNTPSSAPNALQNYAGIVLSCGDDFAASTYHRRVMLTQHLLIKGRVQGVSFRFFTKSRAEKYKISGWVRNLSDGRVEALVQGELENLSKLMKDLDKGPLLAKVETITAQKIDLQESLSQFSILENSESVWKND